ncbi:hypothetical protein APUTEX25_005210, partial [Auxenochlorella protothecoides]
VAAMTPIGEEGVTATDGGGPGDPTAGPQAGSPAQEGSVDAVEAEATGAGSQEAGAGTAESASLPNAKKKRKVALLMAYVGHGYAGMQRNPGVRTIEEDLFRAIHKAGGISHANSDEAGFSKIHWMRAARTDKGVSAVGQVVSLRMVLEDPDILAKINAELPAQVRVFGFGRATHGFDARKHCDKRRYEYILPAWAFDPALVPPSSLLGEEDGEAVPLLETEEDGEASTALGDDEDAPAAGGDAAGDPGDAPPGTGGGVTPSVEADGALAASTGVSQPEDTGFIFDAACAARMTSILSAFEGTHNFHNFTVRVAASAPNARRYILSFRCLGAFDIGGKPWVRLVVVGQSFMLHQIRKMVGLAMAIYRGAAPADAISLALHTRIGLSGPMAPELGLFLDECYYDSYNTQFGKLHGEIHLSDFQSHVDAFKAAQLYPHIAAQDEKEGVNAVWFTTLTDRYY